MPQRCGHRFGICMIGNQQSRVEMPQAVDGLLCPPHPRSFAKTIQPVIRCARVNWSSVPRDEETVGVNPLIPYLQPFKILLDTVAPQKVKYFGLQL